MKEKDGVGPVWLHGISMGPGTAVEKTGEHGVFCFLQVSMAEAEKEFRHQGLWSFLQGAQHRPVLRRSELDIQDLEVSQSRV